MIYLSLKRCVLPTLVVLAGLVAGCQAFGALMYKAAGDPDIPAQYELPNVSTVVLVENYRNAGNSDDAELLGRIINGRLSDKKLVPLVGYEKILELKSQKPKEFRKMTIVEIAQAVGAQQVLYVHLQSGGVASMGGGNVYQGKASVLVKVIDAKTGDTLWPRQLDDGRAMGAETNPAVNGTKPQDEIRSRLYDDLGMQIVRLFHKWKPDSSDTER